MRNLFFTATVVAAGMVAAASAQAMPTLQTGPLDSGIVRVEGGCGPYAHRGPYGRCYPNGRPQFYRACPPGFHLNPYGRCRPNF